MFTVSCRRHRFSTGLQIHDWLYLFRENATYNPLYELGLDRIGCFMCQLSNISSMLDIVVMYPEMWAAKGLWRVLELAEED